jgi:hypothetical protein
MEQSPSSEAKELLRQARNSLSFMAPKSSLLCSQQSENFEALYILLKKKRERAGEHPLLTVSEIQVLTVCF